jgi:HK97 gp10 family phage protein
MAKDIEIIGLEDIDKKLASMLNASKINKALGKACAIVEAAAKQKAPKGEGGLRQSIKSKIENLEGVVYTPLEYAPYIEYGTGIFAEEGGRQDVPWSFQDDKGEWHSTSGMKPRPYLRPALYENREKIKRILREGILDD